MRPHLLLLALLCSSAWADNGRVADTARQQTITADLNGCAKPVWPQESLRRDEKGKVTLAFLIGLDGTVLESKVEESSGYPLLDIAARDGLEKCKFTPPAQVGRTQPQWTKMQYVWTLENRSPEKLAAENAKLQADAEKGDAEAQYKLAAWLLFGPQKDPQQGIVWLRQAASQGHVKAQEALAYELMRGTSTPRDTVEAESWLRKAANSGAPSAQYLMSRIIQGNGGDVVEAREWLRKSAAQDFPHAQTQLASILLRGADADLPEAIELLQQAADKQEHVAQFMLGQCYAQGRGVLQDRDRAMRFYERAAAAGYAPATVALQALRTGRQ
jgi:TonB family protein